MQDPRTDRTGEFDRVVRALESYGDPDGERHERA